MVFPSEMHPTHPSPREMAEFGLPKPSSAIANGQREPLYLHFCFGESYLVLAVG